MHDLRSPPRDATFERHEAFAREYGIDALDPVVAHLLQSIPRLPQESGMRTKQLRSLEQRLAPYRSFHTQYPWRVMSPGAMTGDLLLGSQVANGAAVALSLARHSNLGVIGKTGSGKTTLLLNIVPQLAALGIKLVILDVKNDFRAWAVRTPDCYIIDATAPVAFLAIPSFLTPTEFLAVFEERWRRALFAHEHGRQLLYEAWAKLTFPAALADLKVAVDGLYTKSDTYQRRDAIRGTSMRLQRVADLYPGAFHAKHGVPPEALFDKHVLFTAPTLSDITELLFSLYVGLVTLRGRHR